MQNTAEYPVTAVYFEKADSEDLPEVTHSVTPTALSVSRNTDVAKHQFVDQLLEDKLLANATMTMQWEEPYLKKNQPPSFSSPTLQFITLIFISILAGIVGGVGSYYLFDSKPVQISVVTPCLLYTSTSRNFKSSSICRKARHWSRPRECWASWAAL